MEWEQGESELRKYHVVWFSQGADRRLTGKCLAVVTERGRASAIDPKRRSSWFASGIIPNADHQVMPVMIAPMIAPRQPCYYSGHRPRGSTTTSSSPSSWCSCPQALNNADQPAR